MNLNMSDYGVTENSLNRRLRTEAEHRAPVCETVNAIISDVKGTNGWRVISQAKEYGAGKTDKTNDRFIIAYELQNNKNIITRPEISELRPNGMEYNPRTPLEYKWVDESEKEELGFDAFAYRKIAGSRLEWVKNKFAKRENSCNDILCVLNYFIGRADDRWMPFQLLKAAGEIGIPLKNLASVIAEFEEKHVIATKTVFYGKKERKLIRLCTTEEQYQKAVNNNEVVKAFEQIRETDSHLRRGKFVTIGEKVLKKLEEKEKTVPITENTIPAMEPKKQIYKPINCEKNPLNSENNLDIDEKIDTIVKELIALTSQRAETKVRDELRKMNEVLSQSNDVLQKCVTEKQDAENKLAEAERKIAMLKKQNKSLQDYKDGFLGHASEVVSIFQRKMMIICAKIASMKPYQVKDETFMAQLSDEAIQLMGETVKNLNSYQPDKYAPSLIR